MDSKYLRINICCTKDTNILAFSTGNEVSENTNHKCSYDEKIEIILLHVYMHVTI